MPDANNPASGVSDEIVFRKAREFIHPTSSLHRFMTYLYSERKLLIFFGMHFAATMIIWGHFFLIKWREQEAKVAFDAPFYWLKRVAPSLEFGAMHAILFQMTLIPLTMSRFSIAATSGSILDRFVPLNRMVRIHIHLGYTMVVIVFFATIFFFAFFGVICRSGDQIFCQKFTSEIMISGYVIFVMLLAIAGTSFFRNRIPYEVFYIVHHLVFLMYLTAVLHTIDNLQRKGTRNRSQTFVWFSATILFYVCDRAAMYINHRHEASLVSSTLVRARNGSKIIILKMKRPVLFDFEPGQYAFLRLNAIDIHFHPFSIASDPSSNLLEFCIEVFSETSWTGRLWSLLEQHDGTKSGANRKVRFEVMGPYGTSLLGSQKYSHVLAVGVGTGIVPVLSLLKQHVRKLIRLDPEQHFQDMKRFQHKATAVELARDPMKGSFFKKIARACRDRFIGNTSRPASVKTLWREKVKQSIARSLNQKLEEPLAIKKSMFRATRSVYGIVLLGLLPILGVALIGLTISRNVIADTASIPKTSVQVDDILYTILKASTVVFQVVFGVVAFGIWQANDFFFYIDTVMISISPFADWYWFLQYQGGGRLEAGNITLYWVLIGYMTLRLWNHCVSPPNRHYQSNSDVLNGMQVLWVTRSAHTVSKILPELCETWNQLDRAWGRDKAKAVCPISIYVTEKDESEVRALQQEISGLPFAIHFRRPQFSQILESHSLSLIQSHRISHTLLAFCGSPKLARTLNQIKIEHDTILMSTGHRKHMIEFAAESYGGTKPEKAAADKNQGTGSQIPCPSSSHISSRKLSFEDAADLHFI